MGLGSERASAWCRFLAAAASATAALGACSAPRSDAVRPIAPSSLAFAADSFSRRPIDRGVDHYFVTSKIGPWAINVLDIWLDACYSALAVKGGSGAVGRRRTSEIMRELSHTHTVVGGVNADFFLFAPPGVPANALISDGRVIAGPSHQPVFSVDSLGRPSITTLAVNGHVIAGGRRYPIAEWNRASPDGLALFDAAWGDRTDTLTGAVEAAYGGALARLSQVDTATSGVAIPADGGVLVLGPSAPDSVRTGFGALRPGFITVAVALAPTTPREAVGGRPILVRDSAIMADVDTVGQPGFADGRHPRTAVAIAHGGRRLLLVVVDGRRAGYSDGMTLRELATLMLSLGARDALNLDGGGSTTMVVRDAETGQLLVVNRPSDPLGERPVGNALAIARGCRRR